MGKILVPSDVIMYASMTVNGHGNCAIINVSEFLQHTDNTSLFEIPNFPQKEDIAFTAQPDRRFAGPYSPAYARPALGPYHQRISILQQWIE